MEIVRSAFGREARQWNAVPKKKYVRSGLDALVADFADHMRAEKQQPDRRSDIARIKEAQKSVKKALAILERVGPQALLVLSLSPLPSHRCCLPDGFANSSQTMITRLSQRLCR
jgi:hypothetical protein